MSPFPCLSLLSRVQFTLPPICLLQSLQETSLAGLAVRLSLLPHFPPPTPSPRSLGADVTLPFARDRQPSGSRFLRPGVRVFSFLRIFATLRQIPNYLTSQVTSAMDIWHRSLLATSGIRLLSFYSRLDFYSRLGGWTSSLDDSPIDLHLAFQPSSRSEARKATVEKKRAEKRKPDASNGLSHLPKHPSSSTASAL